jgi:hypothetical protein
MQLNEGRVALVCSLLYEETKVAFTAWSKRLNLEENSDRESVIHQVSVIDLLLSSLDESMWLRQRATFMQII